MKRLLLTLLFLLGSAAAASARDSAQGWCEQGNLPIVTSGLNSTTRAQVSHPSCTVTIFIHGGGLATLFADNNNTPLANPFTAQSGGRWQAYADNGRYDITMSSAGFTQTVTYSDIILCDPFAAGSTCNNGGTTTAHNLLSTTHLDTVPASPPSRGDLVVAQNQTSPTGVNPSWARLPLGTNNQVLTSNGTDAIWAPVAGGGCTPSGTNTGVISEHPIGTCFDSLDWTWDDGASKQNMLLGDGSNFLNASASSLTFAIGQNNGTAFGGGGTVTNVYLIGDANAVIAPAANKSEFYAFGTNNIATRSGGSLWLIGDTNGATDLVDPGGHHGQIYAFGRNNTAISATPGTAVNVNDCILLGESNAIRVTPGAVGLGGCIVGGFSNQITLSGSGVYANIGLYGESNVLTGTVNGIQRTNIIGNSNTVKDTLALSDQVVIAGDSNEVDGSISTVQILGFKNIAHNVSAQNSVTVNTTLVGSAIAATNTGATGSPAYQGAFGATLTLSSCTGCWIVGQGVTNSTNNLLAIGMSTVPEMAITAGHNAITGHIDQSATKNIAGVCSMAAGTSCTFTLTAAYSGTPVCIVTVQSATLTGGVSGCTVSGTTVTITAATNNSLSWGAVLIGNPN